jgi:hypothetical protein
MDCHPVRHSMDTSSNVWLVNVCIFYLPIYRESRRSNDIWRPLNHSDRCKNRSRGQDIYTQLDLGFSRRWIWVQSSGFGKIPTFQRNMSPPSSESKNKPSLPPVSGFLLRLLFDPEEGRDIFLRNVELSPNYTASQPRRSYPLHLYTIIYRVTQNILSHQPECSELNLPADLYNGITALWVVQWTRGISFRTIFVIPASNKDISNVLDCT